MKSFCDLAKKNILEFIESKNKKLPMAVKNSIDDIFDENEDYFTEDNTDIFMYFKDDNEFQSIIHDIDVHSDIIIRKDSTVFDVVKVFTYYGEFNYGYRENIRYIHIKEDGDEIVTFSELEQGQNQLLNPNDYLLIVLENNKKTDERGFERTYQIFIYIPN